MPKKPGFILSRLSNFTRSAKHLIEHLSPRKKHKKPRTEQTDERRWDAEEHHSIITVLPEAISRNEQDVFSAGPSEGFFYTDNRPNPPTEAPQSFTLQFTLPPINISEPLDDENNDQASVYPTRSTHSDESDDLDESDDDANEDPFGDPDASKIRAGKLREAPLRGDAEQALSDIRLFLRGPSKGKGGGYIPPTLDPFSRSRMDGMKTLLALYTTPESKTFEQWSASSLQAALTLGHGRYCARQLRLLCRAYISDRTVLPINPYGDWNQSMLVDEGLCDDINLFLQELGNNITSEKLVEFLARPDVKEKHGITKKISKKTADRYLKALGFRFTYAKKGQYTDGHERDDVVEYRAKVFIPKWQGFLGRMRNYENDGAIVLESRTPGRRIVIWFHDETIYYANDRRRRTWYHKDTPARPYAKGEGVSLMIAEYVSADYGFLLSKCGKRSARRLLKPGKNREGYFTNEDILEQFSEAVSIARETYPDDDHIFVYDNATTHLKRPEHAPSARHMPKKTPPAGKNWLISVIKRDEAGNALKNPDGSFERTKARMDDATFADGSPQPLYFPAGHQREGVFKGMAVILQERGIDVGTKLAQCKNFKCASGATDCCCRRMLFSQPDFAEGESNLEILAHKLGVEVIFLPKFHCELNPIEQCWGYGKRVYRLNPESTREDHLERNAVASLAEIPLTTIRRFANRSRRLIDAYARGVNGRQAAWAARKYRGHRVCPESLLKDLDEAQVY